LARPPDPETRAFQEAWDNALGLARARDYAGAVRELEAASQALRNPAAKADAVADLDLLRLLGAAYADILQNLAKVPKGQKISLELDAGGSPLRVEGVVVRQSPGSCEVKTETETLTAAFDDLTVASLRDLLGKIPGRKK